MINIEGNNWKALLAPELGGAVISLRHGGDDILRPARSTDAVAADPREAACYPCIPWFGRLYNGLDFKGRRYKLAPTLPIADPDHALHGEGWVNPWRVTDQTADRVTCRFDYTSRPDAFPFPFSAIQMFSASPESFQISLKLINTGTAAMPAGLGLHPFFQRTPETRLALDKSYALIAPPGAASSPAGGLQSGAIPAGGIDHSMKDWNGRLGVVQNRSRIAIRSDAPMLHLFAPEDGRFFCLEPVTHLPGCFGGDVLAPGEFMSVSLWIEA